MKYQNIREQVLNAACNAVEMGLIRGTSGNISLRDDTDDVVAITPSGKPYHSLTPEQITIVDLNGNMVDDPFKPSIETGMHLGIMRNRKDIKAVVHTHSLYATVMSMREQPLDRATVPSNMYYPIPTVPFAMPGSEELAKHAVEGIGADGDACLLKNHGLIATGRNLDAAMECAVYVEECAQINYYALAVGFDQFIPEEAALQIRASAQSGKAV